MTDKEAEGNPARGETYIVQKKTHDRSIQNSIESKACSAIETDHAAKVIKTEEWNEVLSVSLDERGSRHVNPATAIDWTLSSEGQEARKSLDELQRWPVSIHRESAIHSSAIQTALPSTRASSFEMQALEIKAAPAVESSKDEGTSIPGATNRKKRKTHWALIRNMLTAKRGLENAAEKKVEEELPSPTYMSKPKLYSDNVFRVALDFPELRDVATRTVRHEWASRILFYDCMDSLNEVPLILHEPWKGIKHAPQFSKFSSALRAVSPHLLQRVILVEDLNPSLISMLGVAFEIPPHVFAEHLDRSGYNPTTEKKIHSDWRVGSSTQGHLSISWYRPVLPLIPLTPETRKKLISGDFATVHHIWSDSGKRNSRLCTVSNIWRSDLGLCCEPGLCYKGSEPEYPVGWEERATIWTREIKGLKYVIVLLDPLPSLHRKTDKANVLDDPQRRVRLVLKSAPTSDFPIIQNLVRNKEHSQSQQKAKKEIAKTQVAILEPIEALSGTMSTSFRLPITDVSGEVTASQNRSKEPSFASSSAQSSVREMTEGAILRSRASTSGTTRGHLAKKQENRLSHEKVKLPLSICQQETVPRISISSPPDQSRYCSPQPTHRAKSAKSQVEEEPKDYTMFIPVQPVKPRLSSSSRVSSTFTVVHMQEHVQNSQVPTSTLEEFEHLFQSPRKGKEKVHEPLEALFRVIYDDTDSLVDIIRVTLRRIREGMLDEDLMQKRVVFWRGLLHRLNFGLSDLDQHLRAFIEFASESGLHIATSDRGKETASTKLAKSTHNTLQYCIDLIERCSSSLLAEMQIVDSRRSITEAESISKLTELAFVFVPLSFVASLFSMQIHQLSNGVSVYVFMLVAVVFVILAYTVRLSIRSSSLLELKNNTLRQLREESELQYNQSIPTRIFLTWSTRILGVTLFRSARKTAKVVMPLLLILAAFAALISPMALLWLRNIDNGFSAVITVLMILLDIILLYPVAVSSDWLSFNPREMFREIHKDLAAGKVVKARRTAKALRRDVPDPEAQLSETPVTSRTASTYSSYLH